MAQQCICSSSSSSCSISVLLLLLALVSPSQAASRLPPGTGPVLLSGRHTTTRPPTIRTPTDGPFQVMSRRVQKLPAMTAMTMADMRRLYSDASAPAALKGSRSSSQADRANGALGASFSDSRLSEDYVNLGQQRSGKILVTLNNITYGCSGSVIQRAVVLTAAHCVCNWGQGSNCFPDTTADGQLKLEFQLDPDGDGNDPIVFAAAGVLVASAWAFGTGSNGEALPNNNDLALIWVYPDNGKQVGDTAGWNAYGTNGYGFSQQIPFELGFPAAPANAMTTSIGLSGNADNFTLLQISQSPAYNMVLTQQPNWGKRPAKPVIRNLVRGTQVTSGASGSPWIVNYGVAPVLTNTNLTAFQSEMNVVVGVTSWGYVDPEEGPIWGLAASSAFGTNRDFPEPAYGNRGAGNIGALMEAACDKPFPEGWGLAALGLCVD